MQTEEIYSPHVNQKCISILNIFGMAVELKEKYEFAFNIKKEGYQNSGEPGEKGRTSKEKKRRENKSWEWRENEVSQRIAKEKWSKEDHISLVQSLISTFSSYIISIIIFSQNI